MRAAPFSLAMIFLAVVCWTTPPAAQAADSPAPAAAAGQLHPAELRCESLVDPLGIGEPSPRLSWIGESARRAEVQSAYQVLVAASPEALAKDQGDLWDSGKVPRDDSAHVAYAGKPLGSRAACFWKVRLWDRDGNPSAWSEPARWTVGLLAAKDWQARWIDTTQGDPASGLPPCRDQARGLRSG